MFVLQTLAQGEGSVLSSLKLQSGIDGGKVLVCWVHPAGGKAGQ